MHAACAIFTRFHSWKSFIALFFVYFSWLLIRCEPLNDSYDSIPEFDLINTENARRSQNISWSIPIFHLSIVGFHILSLSIRRLTVNWNSYVTWTGRLKHHHRLPFIGGHIDAGGHDKKPLCHFSIILYFILPFDGVEAEKVCFHINPFYVRVYWRLFQMFMTF